MLKCPPWFPMTKFQFGSSSYNEAFKTIVFPEKHCLLDSCFCRAREHRGGLTPRLRGQITSLSAVNLDDWTGQTPQLPSVRGLGWNVSLRRAWP